jgi:hypothetical protein
MAAPRRDRGRFLPNYSDRLGFYWEGHRQVSDNTNIHDQIEEEVKAAREACSINGATSPECAAAWDAVEELQAEAAHQKEGHPDKNSFEKYCDDNPDAAECRLYDD